MPICGYPVASVTLPQEDRAKLERAHLQTKASADARPGEQVPLDCPLLVDLGDQMVSTEPYIRMRGSKQIGVTFFCQVPLTESAVNLAAGFDWLIAGSAWNAKILRAVGLKKVSVVLQGIDPAIFHPGPRTITRDQFVVFSGGKLEFRKGQDIVIAAMRVFQRRHPDTVLVGAWHNIWPKSMSGIENAGYVKGIPPARPDGSYDFASWAAAEGISSFVDSGLVRNSDMAMLMREADVALFPNRCEGGTNLVAMECMACGIPTIISANTGHLDLIHDDICYPLRDQRPISTLGMTQWGESSVEEILEILERVYVDRAAARRRGAAAAAWIKRYTWENQIGLLLDELARLG